MESHSSPPCWRNDAKAKVTGQAKYADDLKFCGMAHAVPVYSDHVHAILNAIHIQEALESPGVLRVITAQDAPGSVRFGQILRDCRMLVDDRIRSSGDVIAIVVAENREQAIQAASKINVDATPLPVLLDSEEALRPDAILIHEDQGSNIINEHKVRRGDPDKALSECDLIITQVFRTQAVEHAYLEPESAVVLPMDDGTLAIHGSMQHPFSTRRFVATLLGRPLHEIEIVGTPMGGGFGGKDDTAAMVCARAALAAQLTGRPVKMTYDREWSMRESYKRHPYRIHYTMGLKKDGTIHACKVRILADGGAYCSVTPWVTWRSTVQCCGPYAPAHVHCDALGVYTNNVFTGAMRGFGSPQMNFAVESIVDMAAERLGMDAITLRRKNMVRQGSTTITGQVLDTHTVSLEEALDKALAASGFQEKLKRCSHGKTENGLQYGIGLAISYRGMSLGAEGVDSCAAEILVQPDGNVILETGIHENGQGAESTMILVCASELGLDKERIHYRRSSTNTIPDSGTTVASRGTLMGSGAVVLAARALKEKITQTLGFQAASLKNGRVIASGLDISWEDAIKKLYSAQVHPFAQGTFQAPKVDWDEETGQGNAYFTWVYGCQVAEVLVESKSGKVKVIALTAAHEVGRAINPPMVMGQIYGGLAMGMGYALSEEVRSEEGRVTTLNFDKYRIHRAMDLPEMTGIILEHPDPTSPSGAKGCGEPTLEITAPAIANAIKNATGIRLCSLPLCVYGAKK